MAWPPPIPPNTRTNTDPQQDIHPDDHNEASNALTEIAGVLHMFGQLSATTDFEMVSGTDMQEVAMTTTDFVSGGITVSGSRLVVPHDGVYAVNFVVTGKSNLTHPANIGVRVGPPTGGPPAGNVIARGQLVEVGTLNTGSGAAGLVRLTAGQAVFAAAAADATGKNITNRSLTIALVSAA